jgi:hypothetical protein
MGSKAMLAGYTLGGLGIFGILLFFYIDPMHEGREFPPGQENRVLPYHDSRNRTLRDVTTRITIRNGTSRTTIEKADAGQWRLVEPVAARAARGAVAELLDTLTRLERVGSVQLTDTKWKTLNKYGLKPTGLTCTLECGDDTLSLVVGRGAPGRSRKEKRMYVRVGRSPTVDVVDAAVAAVLARKADTLRDRRVFPHGVLQARRVMIDGPNGEILLEDARDGWRLVKPSEAPVGTEALVELLKAMHELRVVSYVSLPLTGGGTTGLDRPTLTCTLETWDDQTTTLLVGGPAPGRGRLLYGSWAGGGTVFTIESVHLRGLSVRPDDLLERKPDATRDAKPDLETKADGQ